MKQVIETRLRKRVTQEKAVISKAVSRHTSSNVGQTLAKVRVPPESGKVSLQVVQDRKRLLNALQPADILAVEKAIKKAWLAQRNQASAVVKPC